MSVRLSKKISMLFKAIKTIKYQSVFDNLYFDRIGSKHAVLETRNVAFVCIQIEQAVLGIPKDPFVLMLDQIPSCLE